MKLLDAKGREIVEGSQVKSERGEGVASIRVESWGHVSVCMKREGAHSVWFVASWTGAADRYHAPDLLLADSSGEAG